MNGEIRMNENLNERLKESREGHRSRVKERYLQNGLDGFQDYEALELLLFYAVPRKDTKLLAKQLLKHFGSIHEVLGATAEELQEAGLTLNASVLLSLIPQLGRLIEVSKEKNRTHVRSTSDAGKAVCAIFQNRPEESVRVLCLDASGKILKIAEIAEGDVNTVHFPIRKLVEAAISSRAVSVILAHNHPGGTLSPSREDIEATQSAKAALETVGIRLLDHLIASGKHYCSLREEGYL